MREQLFFAAAGGGTVIAGGWLARRYRHDLDAARVRLAAVDRTAISTAFGAVEYAERGAGEPVLSIHGFFGGCDQGWFLPGLPDRRVGMFVKVHHAIADGIAAVATTAAFIG